MDGLPNPERSLALGQRPSLWLVVLAAATLASGCAIFQHELPEQSTELLPEIPDQWTTEPSGSLIDEAGWLADFDDPELISIVVEAWTHNNNLLGAIAKRDGNAALAEIEVAGSRPTVDLQATAGRQNVINDFLGDSNVIPERVHVSRLKVGLGISWELDVWSRVLDVGNAVEGEIHAASLDLVAAKHSLAAQAVLRWYELAESRARAELLSSMAELRADQAVMIKERYDTGLTTAAELQQARVFEAREAAALQAAEMEVDRAARELEVLLGRYPSGSIQTSQALPPLPSLPEAGVPSSLLEQRPDVRAAELRLRAADDKLRSAKKNLLPRFSISASGASQAKYRDLLFQDDSFIWSLGGGIFQPLLAGGKIKAGIAAQRAFLIEAVHTYQDKVLTAFREVEDALAADAALGEQSLRLRETLTLIEDGQRDIEERFQLGSVDARTLLTARLNTLQARRELMDIEMTRLKNRLALYVAVGAAPILPVHAGEIQTRLLGMDVQAWRDDGTPAELDEVGELVALKPFPSMPIHFWNDPDGSRYHEAYFNVFPGVWRHGDFIKINARGGCYIYGRSDSTLNRFGVRIGTAEIYRAVEQLPEIADSLIVCCELPGGHFFMPLFVKLKPGFNLDEGLRARINQQLREHCSPRHVPDRIYAVDQVPYTLTGKKMEIPVRKLLVGLPLEKAASRDAMMNPGSIDYFVRFAQESIDYQWRRPA